MKNIVLLGFMGTGKSVVGKRLARELGAKFVNTDDLIEEREGLTINDIFARSGEPYFREVEAAVVREVAGRQGSVISTGGGVVLNEENLAALRAGGVLFCLNATPEEIYARTRRHAHRPLLQVPDPVAKIRELLAARAPLYAKADHQIDTNGKTAGVVAKEIIALLQQKKR